VKYITFLYHKNASNHIITLELHCLLKWKTTEWG